MTKTGAALRAWRESKSLSQQDAAELLDPPATQGAWASWEGGHKPPSLTNALGIERLTEGTITAEQWVVRRRKQKRHSSVVAAAKVARNG